MDKQDRKIIVNHLNTSLQAFKAGDIGQAFNGYINAVGYYNSLCNESHGNAFTSLLKEACKRQGVAFNAYNVAMFKEHKKAVANV